MDLAFQVNDLWFHPHSTAHGEHSQELLIQNIEDIVTQNLELTSWLLIDPGCALVQNEICSLLANPQILILHQWFQDFGLSRQNSKARWVDAEFTWDFFENQLKHIASEGKSATRFDGAIFKINKSAALNRQVLAYLALMGISKVWVWGSNQEGMKSLPKKAGEVQYEASTLALKKSCRVIELTLKNDFSSQEIELEPKLTNVSYGELQIQSVLGMYGHQKADHGTLALLNTIPSFLQSRKSIKTCLDFGAGTGVLGIVMNQYGIECRSYSDAHSLACEAMRHNLQDSAKIHWDYMLQNEFTQVDLVITNPPFHIGQKSDFSLGEYWLEALVKNLKPHGEVLLVANEFLKFEQMAQTYFSKTHLISKNSGFCVWNLIL